MAEAARTASNSNYGGFEEFEAYTAYQRNMYGQIEIYLRLVQKFRISIDGRMYLTITAMIRCPLTIVFEQKYQDRHSVHPPQLEWLSRHQSIRILNEGPDPSCWIRSPEETEGEETGSEISDDEGQVNPDDEWEDYWDTGTGMKTGPAQGQKEHGPWGGRRNIYDETTDTWRYFDPQVNMAILFVPFGVTDSHQVFIQYNSWPSGTVRANTWDINQIEVECIDYSTCSQLSDNDRIAINRITEVCGRTVGTMAWDSRTIAHEQICDAMALLPQEVQDLIHQHAAIIRHPVQGILRDLGEAGEAGLLRQASVSILQTPLALQQLCLLTKEGIALMITRADAQWMAEFPVVTYGRFNLKNKTALINYKTTALVVDPISAPVDMRRAGQELFCFAQVNDRRLLSVIVEPCTEQVLHIAFHPLEVLALIYGFTVTPAMATAAHTVWGTLTFVSLADGSIPWPGNVHRAYNTTIDEFRLTNSVARAVGTVLHSYAAAAFPDSVVRGVSTMYTCFVFVAGGGRTSWTREYQR